MSKREVPKLNKGNFVAWKSLMKLHLGSIGDYAQTLITVDHIDPTGPLTANDMNKKKEHNQAMLEIASALSYAEYDDIKGCSTTHQMWKTLSDIYRGDDNVKRAKRESLRGKFDDMKMEEGENAALYGARIKEVVSAIRSLGGQLEEEIVCSKYSRTLLPIYAIRVSAIQELRCVPSNTLTFEGIIGRLTTFELSNFDNYKPDNFEFAFKSKMTIKDKEEKTKKRSGKGKYVSSDSSTDEDDVDQLEALLARRFHRGKRKIQR